PHRVLAARQNCGFFGRQADTVNAFSKPGKKPRKPVLGVSHNERLSDVPPGRSPARRVGTWPAEQEPRDPRRHLTRGGLALEAQGEKGPGDTDILAPQIPE